MTSDGMGWTIDARAVYGSADAAVRSIFSLAYLAQQSSSTVRPPTARSTFAVETPPRPLKNTPSPHTHHIETLLLASSNAVATPRPTTSPTGPTHRSTTATSNSDSAAHAANKTPSGGFIGAPRNVFRA